MRVASARGQPVPLREVARITTGCGQPVIERLNRQRLIAVSANLSGRPLGDITAEIDARLAGLEIPPGCRIGYFGVREKLLRLTGPLNPQVVLWCINIQQNRLVSYRHQPGPVAAAGDNLPGAGIAL